MVAMLCQVLKHTTSQVTDVAEENQNQCQIK